MTLRFSIVLFFLLALPAQAPPPTVAEQAFRDAWWAESGQNDLETALRLYLAAATAEGAPAIKAKALLHAGAVQQRLGKAESAMATLRQVLRDHASEPDVVDQARVHLRELTAVDLRQSYDEWYERRLFSEEVQVQILAKVDALVAALSLSSTPIGAYTVDDQVRQATSALLAYGKGAVPALRKAAEARHARLAGVAIDLLIRLDELPAVAALQRSTEWTGDTAAWSMLLRLPPDRTTALPAEVTSDEPHAALLRAALHGPEALLQAMSRAASPSLVLDEPEVFGAATLALLSRSAQDEHRTLATLTSAETPRRMRQAMESGLLDAEPRPSLTAADWLALGAEPTNFNLRFVALQQAAEVLGPGDATLLDEVLRRVGSTATARSELVQHLCSGLQRNVAPQTLPWTVERLQLALNAAINVEDGNLSATMLALQWHDDTRTLLAQTLLANPSTWCHAASPDEDIEVRRGRLHAQFQGEGDSEHDMALLATRWHDSLAGELTARWPTWSQPQRVDGIVAVRLLIRGGGDRTMLLRFVGSQREGATGALKDELDAAWSELGGE